MADSTKRNIYVEGVATVFSDTLENWLHYDPNTIPGAIYASTDEKNRVSLKIGTGQKYSQIPTVTVSNGVPVGTILYMPTTTPPEHYIALSGVELLKEDYPELWEFANASELIIDDSLWLSHVKYHGYFSHGSTPGFFRIPLLDDITLEAWSTNSGRNAGRGPGSYVPGTMIGTEYMFGGSTPSPYMSYFNYTLAIRNGLTTNQNPEVPNSVSIVQNSSESNEGTTITKNTSSMTDREYGEFISRWLDENNHRSNLVHPTKQQLADILGIDTPSDLVGTNKFVGRSTHSITIAGPTSLNYTDVVGMTRSESVAYPVYMKYKE